MSGKGEIKYILRSMSLPAGAVRRINDVASFFMVVSNTGSSRIKISIDSDPFSDFPIGYRYLVKKENEFFKHIDVKNPNAGTVVIEYILSVGIIESTPTVQDLSDILTELKGVSSGEVWGTEKTIGVAQSEVMAANSSRHSGSIQAKSTNTGIIYLGYDNTVLTTKWIAELQPGQAWSTNDWLGAIHAIADAAAQLVGYGEH